MGITKGEVRLHTYVPWSSDFSRGDRVLMVNFKLGIEIILFFFLMKIAFVTIEKGRFEG